MAYTQNYKNSHIIYSKKLFLNIIKSIYSKYTSILKTSLIDLKLEKANEKKTGKPIIKITSSTNWSAI